MDNGVVSAVGKGNATITAKSANGKTATASVTVTNPVTGLKLSYDRTSVYQGTPSLRVGKATLEFIPADGDHGTVVYRGSGNIGGQNAPLSLDSTTGNVSASNYVLEGTYKVWAEVDGVKSNEVTIYTEKTLSLSNVCNSQNGDIKIGTGESKGYELNVLSTISSYSDRYFEIESLSGKYSKSFSMFGVNRTDMSSPGFVRFKTQAGQEGCLTVIVQ